MGMKVVGILPKNSWIKSPSINKIFEALKGANIATKFVGGVVRDAMLGRKINDIDLAVASPINHVIDCLQTAGIRVHPIGAKHGSVLAVIYDEYFHITSLRVDLETDGRYAKVEFTSRWEEDAKRRDFTMNAMYADLDGKLYDPTGQGLQDAKNGIIRFIGEPQDRIKEDFLRIMRFFRFFAGYGKENPSEKTLAAIAKYSAKTTTVSRERLSYEFIKLLEYENPLSTIEYMEQTKVLQMVLGLDNFDLKNLREICKVQQEYNLIASDILKLFALCHPNSKDIFKSLKNLVVTIVQQSSLANLLREYENAKAIKKINPEFFRKQIYNYSRQHGIDLFLYLVTTTKITHIKQCVEVLLSWQTPKIPVCGNDLINIGITPGPEIGRILNELEQLWLDSDFNISRTLLLHNAQILKK